MSQIQAVKEATDIVEVIGARLQLQRSGTYFKGLCPFHGEKSPSFFVNEALQRYKCFGCGESGDVFTFLEKIEGMSFAEALEFLAQKANITLESYKKNDDDELKAKLLEVLNLTKEYYHYLLTSHTAAQEAREYLKDRHISAQSITLFQLGFAPSQWDGLIKYLHGKKKYSLQLLEQAGLVIQGKGGRYYDRFRNRVMFPLRDHRGRVVGFSGRTLEKDPKEAKYINSPETLLYHKSKMLFGYSELFSEIRKEGVVLVVEGEFDVISSAQAHVNNIVAIKGSALTEDHAKLLARTTTSVVLALDTDSAGVAATKKSIEVLKQTGVELRVLQVPGGKDPDEFIRANPKEWRQVAKTSVTAYEFLISAALKQFDPATASGKRKIMEELAPSLATITHAVELEHYSKVLAESLHTKQETIVMDIESYKRHKKLPTPAAQKDPQVEATVLTVKEAQEQYVLYLLFNAPPGQLVLRAEEVAEHSFDTPGINQVIRTLAAQDSEITIKTFAAHLPEDLKQVIFDAAASIEFSSRTIATDDSKEWSKALAKLKEASVMTRINQITHQLALLDEQPVKTPEQEEKQQQLLKEIVVLRRKS